MLRHRNLNRPSLTHLVGRHLIALAVVLSLTPALALAQDAKPKVAILIYDGVQVIDHAIPFEVFGQFALNEVYTVAKRPGPVTTYMGMQVLPNYSFADAPPPDVLVLPGGNTGDARNDSEIKAWVERTASAADHVLTTCTGIFFLTGNELLEGSRVTTWYDTQEALQQAAPEAVVVGENVVEESGKLVSAAGLGIEGALRVLARLHGPAWAEVVRLNMEYEPIPDSLRVPRVELADRHLPESIYSAFPWRQAELLMYEGNREEWVMAWRFEQEASLDALRDRFLAALRGEDGWTLAFEEIVGTSWTSRWRVGMRGDTAWSALVRIADQGPQVDLEMRVHEAGQ